LPSPVSSRNCGRAHRGGPAARREDLDIPLPVERLLRKQHLVHPIYQMHAGVGQTLALLADIEVPGGTRVRQAGDDFAQIMHAAQQDARLIAGTGDRIAKHLGVAPQSLQEPDERIVPPGHHVGQHQLLFVPM
jgi:hypothetical protein